MQNTDLILLKNNKYKYISTTDSSSLIYKDGTYYPATFTQVFKTFKQDKSRDIVNKEIPLYTYKINSYVSDIITYHYSRFDTATNVINNIVINCYVDDELINQIKFYPLYALYAYPTTTFNINKYVNTYKETIQINSPMTSPNVGFADNVWWYIWSISNEVSK